MKHYVFREVGVDGFLARLSRHHSLAILLAVVAVHAALSSRAFGQNRAATAETEVPRPNPAGADPKPENATEAILAAFDKYEVVGLSAGHGNKDLDLERARVDETQCFGNGAGGGDLESILLENHAQGYEIALSSSTTRTNGCCSTAIAGRPFGTRECTCPMPEGSYSVFPSGSFRWSLPACLRLVMRKNIGNSTIPEFGREEKWPGLLSAVFATLCGKINGLRPTLVWKPCWTAKIRLDCA